MMHHLSVTSTVGWPASELYHYQLSQSIGMDSVLAAGGSGRAPSVLNGGLDNVYILFALG